jgi:hypothetical protein
VVGSLPSVVYLMSCTPEPVPSSAARLALTGELLLQPAAFDAGVRIVVTVGALVSSTMLALACDVDPIAEIVCGPSSAFGMSIETDASPLPFAWSGEPVSGVVESSQ